MATGRWHAAFVFVLRTTQRAVLVNKVTALNHAIIYVCRVIIPSYAISPRDDKRDRCIRLTIKDCPSNFHS